VHNAPPMSPSAPGRGRTNTLVAGVLVVLAIGVALVAVYVPEVLDPVRAQLGTLPPPRPAAVLDAGAPAPPVPAPAVSSPDDAGVKVEPPTKPRPPRTKRKPR
jgi:hypothetical protein